MDRERRRVSRARLRLRGRGSLALRSRTLSWGLDDRTAGVPLPRRRPRAGASRAFGALPQKGASRTRSPQFGGTSRRVGDARVFYPLARAMHGACGRGFLAGCLPTGAPSPACLRLPLMRLMPGGADPAVRSSPVIACGQPMHCACGCCGQAPQGVWVCVPLRACLACSLALTANLSMKDRIRWLSCCAGLCNWFNSIQCVRAL
jgi:hypothetical protein